MFTPGCHAHRGVRILELYNQIFQQNRNQILSYCNLFVRGPDRFESGKNRGKKLVTHFPVSFMTAWTVFLFFILILFLFLFKERKKLFSRKP